MKILLKTLVAMSAVWMASGVSAGVIFDNPHEIGQVQNSFFSVEENLQAGDLAYSDRSYLWGSIPVELQGVEWMRIPVYLKGTNPGLEFDVLVDATLYLLYDRRNSMPSWIANDGWTPSTIAPAIFDNGSYGNIPFYVYETTVTAGTYQTGVVCCDTYPFVAGVALNSTPAPEPTTTALLALGLIGAGLGFRRRRVSSTL